jgi:hypothetical protein
MSSQENEAIGTFELSPSAGISTELWLSRLQWKDGGLEQGFQLGSF